MSLFDFENKSLNRKIRDFNEKTIKKILSLEICQVNYKITKLEKANKRLQDELHHVSELEEYIRKTKISYNKIFFKIQKVNLNKIRCLSNESRNKAKIQDRWMMNLSNRELPENVKNLLSLGTKFSLPMTKNDVKIDELIADVENILLTVPERRKDTQRARVTNVITNFIHKNIEVNSPMTRWYHETKVFLKNNEDLIVLNSDKGAVTVIMDKAEYEDKIQTLLNSDDFKLLPRDPTQTIQTQCNKFITRLVEKNYITEQQAKSMKTYNSVAPRIYGNPKVHKPGNPIRPIISSINSPMTSLSRFMASILKAAYNTDNDFYIKDSFQFSDQINNYILPDNYKIVSFDVVNLFGSLEKNLIVGVLKNKWEDIKQHTSMDEDTFFEIMSFLLDKNYCTFRGKFYSQIVGCAMGSELSPIIAQYVMDDLVIQSLLKLRFIIPILKKICG
ncbi:uncharacterized protein LOC123314022 [Coccinella septempunctata]|uniref:uncharacterized protein LOC123314022 n=1 Tax=Coccinella septempunctata TaxID=41139 RepID=UPI001D092CA8|nr:uncharacterized protein LOC123314022 [Coccinella septempunctata]